MYKKLSASPTRSSAPRPPFRLALRALAMVRPPPLPLANTGSATAETVSRDDLLCHGPYSETTHRVVDLEILIGRLYEYSFK